MPFEFCPGQSLAPYRDAVILFGGVTRSGAYTNSVHQVSVAGAEHSEVLPTGEILTEGDMPFGRAYHSSNMVGNDMLVLGGILEDSKREYDTNHLPILSLAMPGKWKKQRVTGSIPPQTKFHSSAAYGSQIFQIGGTIVKTSSESQAGLYQLDTSTFIWREVEALLTVPRDLRLFICVSKIFGLVILSTKTIVAYDAATKKLTPIEVGDGLKNKNIVSMAETTSGVRIVCSSPAEVLNISVRRDKPNVMLVKLDGEMSINSKSSFCSTPSADILINYSKSELYTIHYSSEGGSVIRHVIETEREGSPTSQHDETSTQQPHSERSNLSFGRQFDVKKTSFYNTFKFNTPPTPVVPLSESKPAILISPRPPSMSRPPPIPHTPVSSEPTGLSSAFIQTTSASSSKSILYGSSGVVGNYNLSSVAQSDERWQPVSNLFEVNKGSAIKLKTSDLFASIKGESGRVTSIGPSALSSSNGRTRFRSPWPNHPRRTLSAPRVVMRESLPVPVLNHARHCRAISPPPPTAAAELFRPLPRVDCDPRSLALSMQGLFF